MTPGPEPREAIRQAITNAAARGNVMDRDQLKESRLRFILFCCGLTVFVQVRRTRVHLVSPEDCASEYRQEILHLRRVPLTGVVARELWLLNSWGTWQYFRILDDRVIEIRADGSPLLKEGVRVPAPDPGAVPVPGPEPACVPAPVLASVPAPIPDPGPDFVPDSSPDSAPDHVPDPIPDPGPDFVPDSATDHVPDPIPDPVPDSAPAPDRASRPGLSPVGSAPSSDEGG